MQHAVRREEVEKIAHHCEARVGTGQPTQSLKQNPVEQEPGARFGEGHCQHGMQPEEQEGVDTVERLYRMQPVTPFNVSFDDGHSAD